MVPYTAQPETFVGAPAILKKPFRSGELVKLLQALRTNTGIIQPVAAAATTACPAANDHALSALDAENDRQLPPRLVAQGQFKLKRWPDFRQLHYQPRQVKIAVTIQKRARTVNAIAELCQLSIDEVIDFIGSCYACGYLSVEQTDAADVAAPAAVPTALAQRAGRGERQNLLTKIRSRLKI